MDLNPRTKAFIKSMRVSDLLAKVQNSKSTKERVSFPITMPTTPFLLQYQCEQTKPTSKHHLIVVQPVINLMHQAQITTNLISCNISQVRNPKNNQKTAVFCPFTNPDKEPTYPIKHRGQSYHKDDIFKLSGQTNPYPNSSVNMTISLTKIST